MNSEKLIFEQGNLFDEQEQFEQGDLFKPEETESSLVVDEKADERHCKHGKVKEECETCQQVFNNEMMKLQRQQMTQENGENIGITLLGTEEPEGGYQRNGIFPINHPTRDNNEERKKQRQFRGKLKRTIGFVPRSTEKLNQLLEQHFGVKMKVDPETHYPAQKSITIEGVKCFIKSDSHVPGFYLRVPDKRTTPNKNNKMRKIG